MATIGHVLWGLAVLALVAMAPSASGATSVTIFFDNEGPEEGITTPGATEFSFMGSTWQGGIVVSTGTLQVDILHGPASVTFDEDVESAEFLFSGATAAVGLGTATAFDRDGNILQSVDAINHNIFPDQDDRRVRLDPDMPIARIEFTEGFISRFTFTLVPEPGAGALVALGATLLAARSTRRRSNPPSAQVAPRASRR